MTDIDEKCSMSSAPDIEVERINIAQERKKKRKHRAHCTGSEPSVYVIQTYDVGYMYVVAFDVCLCEIYYYY